MKAIIILHNGNVIEDRLLIPITRELIIKTGAKGEMVVNQLDDDEVQKALVKTVSENINVKAAVIETDQAIVKGIEFLKNKYSDLIPASRNNSIKHLEGLNPYGLLLVYFVIILDYLLIPCLILKIYFLFL